MFIYNVKVSGSLLFKIFFIIATIVILTIFSISCYKIFVLAKDNTTVSDRSSNVIEITPNNYTNILKDSHENIDKYVGKSYKFSGYIYRAYDFTDEQFVLARDMVISSDYQTLIVGFLSEYKDIKNYSDDTWVEVIGTIKKVDYHGDMPELEITSLKEIDKPNDEYVFPPDESYVPTVAQKGHD